MNYADSELMRQLALLTLLLGGENGAAGEEASEENGRTDGFSGTDQLLRPGADAPPAERTSPPVIAPGEAAGVASADASAAGSTFVQTAAARVSDFPADAGNRVSGIAENPLSAVVYELGARELSRCVERDARRYDGQYPLY